jgi:hypothetical protein
MWRGSLALLRRCCVHRRPFAQEIEKTHDGCPRIGWLGHTAKAKNSFSEGKFPSFLAFAVVVVKQTQFAAAALSFSRLWREVKN